jgi:predicted exporter
VTERLLARAWALASVLLVAFAAYLLARGAPLQTNLLALLPPTEHGAAAERAVAAMHDAASNRAVFLVSHRSDAGAREAARRFAAQLEASRAFARVQLDVPLADPRLLIRAQLDYRFGLLAEADRAALREGRFDAPAWLARRMNDPLRTSLAGGLAADPFGFFDRYFASLPYRSLRLEVSERMLVAHPEQGEGLHVLVGAELPGSAYDDSVQGPVLEAVARAEAAARALAPDIEVLRTGAVFFAADARSAAQREVDVIGLGSVAGIVLLLLAVFRTLRPLALGLLTVVIGLAAAISLTVTVHGELHLLTLVFGASLIGEAIDYSIQYFGAYAGAGRDWDPQRGMALVRPGLTLALATSLLGYTALLLLPFPAVKQIALFSLAGLAAAYLSVVLLLPRLLRKPYTRDISGITTPTGRFIEAWRARVGPGAGLAIALLVALACLPGWLALERDDDVRSLSNRSASLLRQEARIRGLTGFEIGSYFFLVEGRSAEEVLRREEALAARLQELARKGELGHYQALSSFVPSAARQTENRKLVGEAVLADGARLERVFDQAGLRKGVAGELARAYKQSEGRLLGLEAWLASPASTPFRHLWLGAAGGGAASEAGNYASVVVPFGARGTQALEAAAGALEGVSFLDKTASVSRLFRNYRDAFSWGLAAAAAVVLGVLSRRYGWRGGLAVLAPTLLGIAASLALAGYTGMPYTLFSVMALMLVLGVGVNYSIFLVEGRGRAGATFVAVLLSAATTVLSFGLLGFSGTAALAQFGKTLVAGIGVAVLLAPLSLSLAPWRR